MSPRPDHWPPRSYDFAIPQWLHDIGAGLVPMPTSDRKLFVKDGINGTWFELAGNVDDYAISQRTFPGSPRTFAATAVPGGARLSWNAGTDGGRPIVRYEVAVSGEPAVQLPASKRELNITLTGESTVSVWAVSSAGRGPASTLTATPGPKSQPVEQPQRDSVAIAPGGGAAPDTTANGASPSPQGSEAARPQTNTVCELSSASVRRARRVAIRCTGVADGRKVTIRIYRGAHTRRLVRKTTVKLNARGQTSFSVRTLRLGRYQITLKADGASVGSAALRVR